MSADACPDAGVLHDLAQGTLGEEEATDVRHHLDDCDRCLAAMGALLASSRGDPSGVAQPLDLVGTCIGERYEVSGRIGSGATAVVYEAWDRTLERTVALKTVATLGNARADRLRDRLVAESKTLAKLKHPNVVAVHDVLLHGDLVVIAMERIEGESLRTWAERRPPAELLRVLADAARGLAAAHAVGIVHRDFKPENVLVTGESRPLVVDFGLARTRRVGEPRTTLADVAAPLTASGWVVGTPVYMPPEQWKGEVADARADIYALCVTAYELLAGRRPYQASTADALQSSKLRGEFTPLPRTIPPRARRAIERGLHPDPAERPTTMLVVAGELSAKAPNLRTRAAWAIAAASLGVAGVIAEGSQPSTVAQDPCRDEPPAAILAKTRARAADTHDAEAFDPALDRYASDFAVSWTRACEVDGVEGELERSCLETQRLRVDATLGLFADGAFALRDLLARIPSPGDCRAESIGAKLPSPDAAVADEVAALRARLVVVEERVRAGLHDETRGELDELLGDAEALGYRPLEAEVEYWRGMLEVFADDRGAARPHLLAAARVAVASGHHSTAARAWLELMTHELEDGEVNLARADEYAGMARAALDALGGGPGAEAMEALYALRLAYRHSHAENEELAIEHFERVLTLTGPHSEVAAAAHEGMSTSYRELGRFAEAARAARASLDARIEQQGPNSVAALYGHYNLAAALTFGERFEQAQTQIDRGLEIAVALGPAGAQMRLHFLNLRQHVYVDTDRDDAELEALFEEMRAALDALGEPAPLLRASLEETVAGHAFRRGQFERAAKHVAAGLVVADTLSPPDELSTSLQVLGIVVAHAREDGPGILALASALEASPALQKKYRELDAYYAGSLELAHAIVALERDQLDLAEEHVGRALATFDSRADMAPSAVQARDVWARSLWERGRRREARELAGDALGLLRDMPAADRPPGADELERWAKRRRITAPQPVAEPDR